MKAQKKDSTNIRSKKSFNIMGCNFSFSGESRERVGETIQNAHKRLVERREDLLEQRRTVEVEMQTDGGTCLQRFPAVNAKAGRGVGILRTRSKGGKHR